jgi:hypothetical protein
MAFSLEPFVEKIPVTLSLLQLELLVTTCRRQDLHLSFKREVSAPFRYALYQVPADRQNAPTCVLRSNDLLDVVRFLGLDLHIAEPDFPNATSRPTERLIEPADASALPRYVSGPVQLKQGLPAPLVLRDLPQLDNGQLDHTSPRFRDRVHALGLKSGKPLMECKKALFQAEGEAEKSLEILAQPPRYRSTI